MKFSCAHQTHKAMQSECAAFKMRAIRFSTFKYFVFREITRLFALMCVGVRHRLHNIYRFCLILNEWNAFCLASFETNFPDSH